MIVNRKQNLQISIGSQVTAAELDKIKPGAFHFERLHDIH